MSPGDASIIYDVAKDIARLMGDGHAVTLSAFCAHHGVSIQAVRQLRHQQQRHQRQQPAPRRGRPPVNAESKALQLLRQLEAAWPATLQLRISPTGLLVVPATPGRRLRPVSISIPAHA